MVFLAAKKSFDSSASLYGSAPFENGPPKSWPWLGWSIIHIFRTLATKKQIPHELKLAEEAAVGTRWRPSHQAEERKTAGCFEKSATAPGKFTGRRRSRESTGPKKRQCSLRFDLRVPKSECTRPSSNGRMCFSSVHLARSWIKKCASVVGIWIQSGSIVEV